MINAMLLTSAALITMSSGPSISHQTLASMPLHTIGQVTWHAKTFVGKDIRVQGYLLKKEVGYLIFSDEISGKITPHDLPVTGGGLEKVKRKQKYMLEGKFMYKGLKSSNHNLYHLELSRVPQSIH